MTNDKLERPQPPPVPGKPSAIGESSAEPGSPAKPEPLQLPRGAMLVMRASGGIHFTTREMVVYADGRVTRGTGDVSRKVFERAGRVMQDAHVVRLRRMLEQSGFFRMKAQAGTQSPDGYAYEIIARLGGRTNGVEVFTGTMPGAIQTLVDFLMKFMPEEVAASDQQI